jgi:hypothetical protein
MLPIYDNAVFLFQFDTEKWLQVKAFLYFFYNQLTNTLVFARSRSSLVNYSIQASTWYGPYDEINSSRPTGYEFDIKSVDR